MEKTSNDTYLSLFDANIPETLIKPKSKNLLESEIKLNLDHENFKKEIDINQKKYESLIDEAADQISNFVKKAKLENISK